MSTVGVGLQLGSKEKRVVVRSVALGGPAALR